MGHPVERGKDGEGVQSRRKGEYPNLRLFCLAPEAKGGREREVMEGADF